MKVFICSSEAGPWLIVAKDGEAIEKFSRGELEPFEDQTEDYEASRLHNEAYRDANDLTTLEEWEEAYCRHHGIIEDETRAIKSLADEQCEALLD